LPTGLLRHRVRDQSLDEPRPRAEAAVAQEQWAGLHATLSKLDCKIELGPAATKLADMVFTANAGLAVASNLSPAIFVTKSAPASADSRAGWKNAVSISWLPMITISKAKATPYLRHVLLLWLQIPVRHQIDRAVAEMLGCLVVSVELVDPRFYHLDTCFVRSLMARQCGFPPHSTNTGNDAIRSMCPT